MKVSPTTEKVQLVPVSSLTEVAVIPMEGVDREPTPVRTMAVDGYTVAEVVEEDNSVLHGAAIVAVAAIAMWAVWKFF